MPVPILFTIPNFITAGSGQVMMNILKGLDREKFAPAVCLMRKGGRLDREVQDMGLPFLEARFTVPARPYSTLLIRSWKVAKVFRGYGFALWHSWHYLDDYVEPIIARFAGASRWIYTKKAMSWGSRAWLVRSYLASCIATDNSEMPSMMFDRIGLRSKVRVIHHGVEPERFRPDIRPRLELRSKLSIPAEAILVGCVAHLVPVKGHPTLLEALSRVPGMHAALAGRPDHAGHAEHLQKMASELGIEDRVHFLGHIDDVPAFLTEMDVAVLPTWAKWRMEGCPVALLEAMASGTACVATDIPGVRDIIQHERNGLIVPPEDSDTLARTLAWLAADPDLRYRLGVAARKCVLARFTVAHEAAAYNALYQELLGF